MNWKVEPNGDKSIIDSLSNELKVDTIISSMLVRRGIANYSQAKFFFRPSLNKLHDPFLMKDMNIAVERILSAIENAVTFRLAVTPLSKLPFIFPDNLFISRA